MITRKKTIIIFGISSFVGSNLAEFLKKDFRIIGTYFRNRVELANILTLPCDVLAREEVQLVLYAFRPDYVIYAIGTSSVIKSNLSKEYTDALNTAGLFIVTDNSQRYKAQVIYPSMHYVFSGDKRLYREVDIPDPNTVLGKTKASAEFYLQKNSLNYLIFRCCHLYGRSITSGNRTLFETLQYNSTHLKNSYCDHDIRMGFLDVIYLSLIIKKAILAGEKNRLFHVSSKDCISHYEFAQKYCQEFGIQEGLIQRHKVALPLIENRTISLMKSASDSFEYYLDVANIESFLDVKMPAVTESLALTFHRMGGEKKSQSRKGQSGDINFI